MRFTVLGSQGFIGHHLCSHLRSIPKHEVLTDEKGLPSMAEDWGHVFYGIGVTSDFRSRAAKTIRAHVCELIGILEHAKFSSLTYMSSTWLYDGASNGKETAQLYADPSRADDIYRISKMMGEAACLAHPLTTVRIVRISSVLGHDRRGTGFVQSLIREALSTGKIHLSASPDSSKDYIWIDDLVAVLLMVATNGSQRIYNVASGCQTTHREIVRAIQEATGCSTTLANDAPHKYVFPAIDVSKLEAEFGFRAKPVLPRIVSLCREYQQIPITS